MAGGSWGSWPWHPLSPLQLTKCCFLPMGLCQLQAESVIRLRFLLQSKRDTGRGKTARALGDSEHSSYTQPSACLPVPGAAPNRSTQGGPHSLPINPPSSLNSSRGGVMQMSWKGGESGDRGQFRTDRKTGPGRAVTSILGVAPMKDEGP